MLGAGTRIGAYEILGDLGAGGMGEVYRARDARIGRDVAIKILPNTVSHDRDRLARFQEEARAAGILNHPNLLVVHELGIEGDSPFIVSELLEGSTLRDRLSGGGLPQRKVVDYARQIAAGIAAAHEKGIVHRDLKPENIFVTKDGRVKILDFGLAKLRASDDNDKTNAPTQRAATNPGTVLGTVGYMSPEQVRGETADHRSDVFSFGAILFEMITGRRAFKGSTSVETMNAILNHEPAEISATNPESNPALERIVSHCLEKDPEQRFQSSRDLLFDLEAISDLSSSDVRARTKKRMPAVPMAIAIVVALLAAAGAYVAGRFHRGEGPPQFRRITFRAAPVSNARFTPDGQSVVTNESLGTNEQIYAVTPGTPEARPLGLGNARLLSISKNDELAVLLRPQILGGFFFSGTLARVPLAGGAPREIANDVLDCDWAPDGNSFAIIRTVGGRNGLEYPIGHVLYRASGWLSHVRVSPDGDEVAVIEHPTDGDDGGAIAVIDLSGKHRLLTGQFASAQGLAWSRDGKSIWFTAATTGNSRCLYRVPRNGGGETLVVSAPNTLTVLDVAKSGRVLVAQSNERLRLFATDAPGHGARELSWLDWSLARDFAPDAHLVLFDETGEGATRGPGVYVRKTDGSPAVRLGDGEAMAFSPDRRWVVAVDPTASPHQLLLYPTGAGDTRRLTSDAIDHLFAAWLADGRIAFTGQESNHAKRMYVMDANGQSLRAISPEGIGAVGLRPSPDSRWIAGHGGDGRVVLYSTAGGPPIATPLESAVSVSGWTSDSRGLLFIRRGDSQLRIYRYDVPTGRVELFKDISIPATDVITIDLFAAPDAATWATTVYSSTADVYIVDGAR